MGKFFERRGGLTPKLVEVGVIALTIWSLGPTASAGTLYTFNDGVSHTISNILDGEVDVDGVSTTIQLPLGGGVDARPGGAFAIHVNDGDVNVAGGSVFGGDGPATYAIWDFDATIDVSSGSITAGSGGVTCAIWNSGGTVDVTGGTISAGVGAYGIWSASGHVDISGGNLSFASNSYGIFASGGTVDIVGTGFNFPYGPLPTTNGTLTGALADGTPINVPFSEQPGVIILVRPIPEPATGSTIGISAAVLLIMRPRRKTIESPASN